MAFFVNLFRYWTSSYLVLLGFSSYEWVFCGRNGFSPGSTEFRDFLRGIFRNFTQFYWVWWPRRYRITGRHSRHSDWCFFYDPTPVPISARGQLDRAISQSPIDRNSISNDPDGRPPPPRPRHAPAHTKKKRGRKLLKNRQSLAYGFLTEMVAVKAQRLRGGQEARRKFFRKISNFGAGSSSFKNSMGDVAE